MVGMPSVDAGGGWLIVGLPLAELAVHPTDGAGHHELYLMCDDIQVTLAELRGKGVEVARVSPIRAGGLSQQSAWQTARSFPSTSPGIRRHFEPDRCAVCRWGMPRC
jgi:hypothetical protein